MVLESTEYQSFDIADMEFVEVLKVSTDTYLHGVRIIDDCYAEDVYMLMEVKQC